MNTVFVVIVGRSGAGKSTFIETMGLPSKYHCVLSKPMVDEICRRGQPINHDNIHALAKEWYSANKWWQLDYLLGWAKNKPFVFIDGLRYAFELDKLRHLFFENLLVIKIIATQEDRFSRLLSRGKIPLSDKEEFARLEEDESMDMDIEKVLNAAHLTIENFGTVQDLRDKSIRFGKLLKRLI